MGKTILISKNLFNKLPKPLDNDNKDLYIIYQLEITDPVYEIKYIDNKLILTECIITGYRLIENETNTKRIYIVYDNTEYKEIYEDWFGEINPDGNSEIYYADNKNRAISTFTWFLDEKKEFNNGW